jgi:hypothetical protein
VSSAEKLKDRFYSWHRKSEPYCSLTLPSKLSQLFSSERRNSTTATPPTLPATAPEPLCTEEEGEDEEPLPPTSPRGRQASLEEIVGEIVMQNVGLQRAVRRSRSLGRPRDSAADSSSDCEHRSPRQRLRAQRLARMCALRAQQETLQRSEPTSRPLSFLQQWHVRNQHSQLARSQEDDEELDTFDNTTSPEQLQIVEPTASRRGSSTSLDSRTVRTVSGDGPPSPGKLTPTRSPSFLGVLASFGSKLMVSAESLQAIDPPTPPAEPKCPTPMFKNGSRSLGARIANNNSGDYANPQTLLFGAKNEEREEDVYEDSLSAVLDQEEFYRDSAIFSDEHDEPTPKPAAKVPPPVPAKPARKISKSGQHNEAAQPEEQPAAKPKGWVKQMVGRIQAGADS